MKSPFPGMDPWVEHPAVWPGVHQRMITYAGDALQERVGAGYDVVIGERVYVEESSGHGFYPDVSIAVLPRRAGDERGSEVQPDEPTILVVEPVEHREVFLEIRDAHRGNRVATVIEVLSPANKRSGPGRDLYLAKQREVLASTASLVEIDLLRAGEPTVAAPAVHAQAVPYRAVVSPAEDRRQRALYGIALRARLPRLSIPLRPGDAVVLDLQAIFEQVYARGAFGRRLDYTKPPVPPLAPEDDPWAKERIAALAANPG